MRNLYLIITCLASIHVTAQKMTIKKCGWITETQTYYAKSGRDMDFTDTLVLKPLNKAWQMCCLGLNGFTPRTLLFDVGVYNEKQQNAYTIKAGIGAYLPNRNAIVTGDYHRTLETKAQAFGLNFLKQLVKVDISSTTVHFYAIRAGFNVGAYKPYGDTYRPYIEPKIGLVMPFGRGHLYASYRIINHSTEEYCATSGWNIGSTTLFNL